MTKKKINPQAKEKKSKKIPIKQKNTNPKVDLVLQLKKIFVGVALLLVFVVAVGILLNHFLTQKPQKAVSTPSKKEQESVKVKKKIVPIKPVHKPPEFEIYPENIDVSKTETKIDKKDKRPKLAIIIDDIGYDKKLFKQFLALNAPITLAILPNSPFQKKMAIEAHEKGLEIMLHLPMEPKEYPHVNPGKGVLLTQMSPDELILTLEKNLNTVPFVAGVNNHMGSRLTEVSTKMYQIFSILKKNDLFFIDSLTTPKSICKPSARLLQLPFAQRDVFIDNIQNLDYVRKQMRTLIRIAQKYGVAIGIGHPYQVTYDVLHEFMPVLYNTVKLVPASSVVEIVD